MEEETVRKLNDSSCGHMTVVYLPSKDELTALKQNGCMQPDELMAVRFIFFKLFFLAL